MYVSAGGNLMKMATTDIIKPKEKNRKGDKKAESLDELGAEKESTYNRNRWREIV